MKRKHPKSLDQKAGKLDPRSGDGINGKGIAIYRQPPKAYSDRSYLGDSDFNLYLFTLQRWWKILAVLTIVIAGGAGLCAKYIIPKVYRANATLRPTPYSSMEDSVSNSENTDLSWLTGEPGKAESSAQEYIATFQSLAFNTGLAERHHLSPHDFMRPNEHLKGPVTPWTMYRLLRSRLNVEYSFRSGNLMISFDDGNPVQAAQILGYYIDDLRSKLRTEEIDHSRAAVASLQSELDASSDPLLKQNMYLLLAKEIERAKLAELQADFAFKIIDPPFPPDRPYWPSVRWITMIAALAALALLLAAALLNDYLLLSRGTSRVKVPMRGPFELPPEARVEPDHDVEVGD